VDHSHSSEAIVGQLVKQVCNRDADKADFQVYVPVLEKYGLTRGKLIVERSLFRGQNNE
jgi:hypothetical protein